MRTHLPDKKNKLLGPNKASFKLLFYLRALLDKNCTRVNKEELSAQTGYLVSAITLKHLSLLRLVKRPFDAFAITRF